MRTDVVSPERAVGMRTRGAEERGGILKGSRFWKGNPELSDTQGEGHRRGIPEAESCRIEMRVSCQYLDK